MPRLCHLIEVLNPHHKTKSDILDFKDETVKEILSVVPSLAEQQATQLLRRGNLGSSLPIASPFLC